MAPTEIDFPGITHMKEVLYALQKIHVSEMLTSNSVSLCEFVLVTNDLKECAVNFFSCTCAINFQYFAV